MKSDDRIDLGWGAFAGRMLLGLVWMLLAIAAGQGMADPTTEPVLRLILTAVVTAPALLWFALVMRKMRRGDEYEQRMEITALVSGGLYAVMLGLIRMAIGVGLEVAGWVELGDTMNNAISIPALPPLAMLFGQAMAQFARRNLSKAA